MTVGSLTARELCNVSEVLVTILLTSVRLLLLKITLLLVGVTSTVRLTACLSCALLLGSTDERAMGHIN